MRNLRFFILFYAVFFLAGILRLYNVNWDSGFHMHPDERSITLSVISLAFPTSLTEFFSPDSPWNPKFFAYGSLPFYLLYVAGNIGGLLQPAFATYESINIIGRYLSAFFDLGTLVFVFLIGRKILPVRYALLGMFFYAISVLPIQLSHFYAVDTILTFFITGTLYFLIRYYESYSTKDAVLIGLFFGAALATKISAMVLLVSIGTALTVDYLLLILRQPRKQANYLPHLPKFLRRFLKHTLIILIVAFLTFLLLEPYALIDFPTFIRQTIEQSKMTASAFTFPYTLQYVGKLPYIYEIRNLMLFGQGILLGILCLAGILFLTYHAFLKQKKDAWAKEFIPVMYFWIYFIIVGNFAIGFMRYMLPLYPLLAVTGAFFLYQGVKFFPVLKSRFLLTVGGGMLCLLLLIWPLSFMQIYQTENTRIRASNWIHTNIPPGKVLGIEHWDDALPLTGQMQYPLVTLTLYDEDTPQKWDVIRQQLREIDYLILASNRLYTPLMKLTDCKSLPPGRCYTDTAEYYTSLFNGSLGFEKVADIYEYPTVPLTNISMPDQHADESFTVYDHPRIMIFKKIE